MAGCVHVSSQRNPKYKLPPTDPWDVIFLKGFPTQPHDQLGTISLEGSLTSWENVLTRAREKAAEMGGTAIVILTSGERYEGSISLPGSYSSTTTGSASGTFNAYQSGAYIYGSGRASGQSETKGSWLPGPSIAIHKKVITGFVIKLKENPKEMPKAKGANTTSIASKEQDDNQSNLDKILDGIKMEKEKKKKMVADWVTVSQLAKDESIPKEKRRALLEAFIEEYGDANPFRVKAGKMLLPLDPGKLFVRTIPAGANVVVNGIDHGKSPAALKAVAGQYEIVASKAGFSQESLVVYVYRGELKEVTLELNDKFGTLFIDSDPGNSMITIGKGKPAPTPLTWRLKPGKYHLTATHVGYLDKEMDVVIYAGKKDMVNVTFTERIKGTLILDSTPRDAEITINGDVAGNAPLSKQLDPGDYTVLVAAEGFVPNASFVSVESGQNMEVSINLQRIFPMNPYKKWGHISFWNGLGFSVFGSISAVLAAKAADEHKAGNPSAADRSRTWAGACYTAFGLGGALMATGIVLWILSPGDKEWYQSNNSTIGLMPNEAGATLTIGGRW